MEMIPQQPPHPGKRIPNMGRVLPYHAGLCTPIAPCSISGGAVSVMIE